MLYTVVVSVKLEKNHKLHADSFLITLGFGLLRLKMPAGEYHIYKEYTGCSIELQQLVNQLIVYRFSLLSMMVN